MDYLTHSRLESEYVSITHAARIAGLTPRGLQYHIKQGHLEAKAIGIRSNDHPVTRKIHKAELYRFIDSRKVKEPVNITPEVNAQLAETFACEPDAPTSGKGYKPQSILTGPKSKQRLVIRFDPDTQIIYREGTKNKVEGNRLRGAVVTHMVINEGARTPTGGVFTSIRFTVKYDNRTWVGQTKNGTDVVRLRRYI